MLSNNMNILSSRGDAVKASDIKNDVIPGETETPNQTETEPTSTEPKSGNYVAPSTGAAGVCVGKRKK